MCVEEARQFPLIFDSVANLVDEHDYLLHHGSNRVDTCKKTPFLAARLLNGFLINELFVLT
jgi:hypothetical protein